MREVKIAALALLSEWKLGAKDWPTVLECISSVLNNSPLRHLGLRDSKIPGVYRTPMEVFTGHKPGRPLLRAVPLYKHEDANSEDQVRVKQVIGIESLLEGFEAMHRDVTTLSSKSRKRAVEKHNRQTNVKFSQFGIGDYVLIRDPRPGGHKLKFTWRGPSRIIGDKSGLVYEVENLISGKRETVHSRRLLFYLVDLDGQEVSLELLATAKHTESAYELAECIKSIRKEK